MTGGDDSSNKDGADWDSIVNNLRKELRGTMKWVDRQTLPLGQKVRIFAVATQVLKQAANVDLLDYGWGEDTPATPASAGVLNQALVAMRNEIENSLPFLILPDRGSAELDPKGPANYGHEPWGRGF